MKLEIMTSQKVLYKGDIDLVQMPGVKGPFEVLNNHAPIISLLERGRIRVIDSERNMFFFAITGGMVKVKDNHITILADATEA